VTWPDIDLRISREAVIGSDLLAEQGAVYELREDYVEPRGSSVYLFERHMAAVRATTSVAGRRLSAMMVFQPPASFLSDEDLRNAAEVILRGTLRAHIEEAQLRP
jgi:hypothetical protein